MRYQKWGKSGCKLVCYSRDKSKVHMVKDPDCPNDGVWADEIEAALLEDLFSFEVRKNQTVAKEEKNVIDILRENEKKLNDKLKRLYSLYAEADDDALKETINEVKNSLKAVENQIRREEKQQILSKKKSVLKKQLVTLRESWEYMTSAEKRNIVLACVDKVVIKDDDVQFFYTID